jgi:hypothetical protein
MRKARRVLVICLATIGVPACAPLVPPARPYTVTGLVEAVGADALTLRHKSGQRINIAFVPTTAVSRRDRPAAIADVTVGMRIVVLYRMVEGRPVADEVHLFRDAIKAPA